MKALLVIDMQNEGMKGLYKKRETIENISRLVDAFREHKVIMSKVWIKDPKKTSMTRFWPGEGIAGTKGAEIIQELRDKHHDLVIRKTNYSSFYKTRLDSYLKRHGIRELYLTGIHAGCCVLFTGVDAFYRGYDVYYVKDAVTSQKRYGKEAMKRFEMFCGKTISTEELIGELITPS